MAIYNIIDSRSEMVTSQMLRSTRRHSVIRRRLDPSLLAATHRYHSRPHYTDTARDARIQFDDRCSLASVTDADGYGPIEQAGLNDALSILRASHKPLQQEAEEGPFTMGSVSTHPKVW